MRHPDTPDDQALREAFEALGQRDARKAPDFASMLGAARSRRARRRAGIAGLAGLAVAAVALLVSTRSVDSPFGDRDLGAELIASHGVWRAPTDFLLEGRSEPIWRMTITVGEAPTYTRIPQ